MKNIPTEMQEDLDGGATKHCYCWSVALTNGTTLGFTDHDRNLTFESVTFRAMTGMDASALSNSRNLSVDDMDAIGMLSDDSITDSDIAAGKYNGAMVTIYKVDWSDVSKRIILMRGPIGTISWGQLGYKAQMKNLAAYANQQIGRVYTPKCWWTLGEGICAGGVNLESAGYRDTGLLVSAVVSARTFECVGAGALARSGNFYQYGKVVWTGGDNAGYAMSIKSSKVTSNKVTFELFESMPAALTVGDAFTAYAGCAKTIEVCGAKFDNVVNFGGFPRMPGPDVIMSYPKSTEKNDGGSLY